MPLDAICLSAITQELSERIVDMKIDKVQQPERDIILLSLRGKGAAYRLLISAGTGDARLHLTGHQFENPKSPPMFCMLLRKHIIGARIIALTQPSGERMVVLELNAPDALGILSEKCIIVELIGRMSNIILTDSENIIIDCLRRIGGDISDKRAVLPGLLYRLPPVQAGKLDPMKATAGQWQAAFDSAADRTVDKWLLSTFSALSPLICRELSWRSYGCIDQEIRAIKDGGESLRREFFSLMDIAKAGGFEPWSLYDASSKPRDFSYFKIGQYENACILTNEDSFSDMLDGFYTRNALLERLRQRASATLKTIKTARDRLVRKLAMQKEELLETQGRDKLREAGDIITANLHLMIKGQKELLAQDFYSDEGEQRSIKLDPLKTPQQNAARYYKEYTKAKKAEAYLEEQIRLGGNELDYLESVIEALNLAEGEGDLAGIRQELMDTGYIKAPKPAKNKKGEANARNDFAPMRFESSSGLRILAGRNNMQNEQLTLKTAEKSDIWLHCQKSHGAHVLISCDGKLPDEESLYEAASIAAHFSSARNDGKTSVDYTLAKNVRKPKGGRPGMVIYTDYKTIVAIPDEELVNRLRRN